MEQGIPEKRYFRIGEVSALTELEPHVIRYWEKEFSPLKPLRADSHQRLYTRADVKMILHIRRLLHEERYTIAGAKKILSGRKEERPRPEPVLAAASPEEITQPELPLFTEGKTAAASPVGRRDHTELLIEIKQELGRIIRILS